MSVICLRCDWLTTDGICKQINKWKNIPHKLRIGSRFAGLDDKAMNKERCLTLNLIAKMKHLKTIVKTIVFKLAS